MVEEAAVMSLDDNRSSVLADGTAEETNPTPAPEIVNPAEETQLNLNSAALAGAAGISQ